MAADDQEKVTSDEISCNEKGEVEIKLFEVGGAIPLAGSPWNLYPGKSNPTGSWVSIQGEFAIEGALSLGLPEGEGEEEGKKEASDLKTKILNSIPLEALAANFSKASTDFTHTSAKNLKMKVGGFNKGEKELTVGEITLGEFKVKVPDFSTKAKNIDVLTVPITLVIAKIGFKDNVAQVFPLETGIEIPLITTDLGSKGVFTGEIKLVGKLSAGINGYKLLEQAGEDVAEEVGEEAAASFAAEAAIVLVAVIISIAIVIVMEKLLYGAVDDFKTLDERANEACDAFMKAFAAALKGEAQPAAEDAVAGPNGDGYKGGTDVRNKVLEKWKSTPPKEVNAKMKGGMKFEDAVKAVGIPDNVVSDLSAKARAQYVPMARLKIATDFCSSHSSEHAMIAATIEHWWVGGNTTGNDQINRVITPAGWANVPANLKPIYQALRPPGPNQIPERLRIQGVDPEPVVRTPEQAQAEWDAWAKKNSGSFFGTNKFTAAAKFLEFFPGADALSDPRFTKYSWS